MILKMKSFVFCHSREDGNPRVVFFRVDPRIFFWRKISWPHLGSTASGLAKAYLCFLARIRKGNNAGFTLVETLVAISILMLSVTGPLYYASESLKAATYARDQITAFYLAQDAFEQIRKIRDDNIYTANDWNNGLTGCETSPSLCTVTDTTNNFYIINKVSNPSSDDWKYLYISSSGLYSHNTNGTKTIFKRSVRIEPNDSTNSDNPWEGVTEIKITVLIEWNSRGTDRSFTAYEFLRNLK